MAKNCFMNGDRICDDGCMAYYEEGSYSRCRLLTSLDRLSRNTSAAPHPAAPPPKVRP